KGVKSVAAVLTAQREAEVQAAPKAAVADPHGMEKNPKLKVNAKKIIAVASGKGGVGKSTVAAGLARQLAAAGQRIGLLDADIYGPSQPTLFGLKDFKPDFTDDKKIIPAEVGGVKVMSIGFMVDAEKALVWRGPMVQSAIYQMFRDVEWADAGEPLDVLIVDMPPGTGDAQLTLAQKIDVDGAVIVSTPQELALADARKAVEMFGAVGVPILGLVENMSSDVFGRGGARSEAEKLGVPFLGEIELSADIRGKADAGEEYAFPEGIISALT
ncbi:MAG: Mrp/NBP35 family ATP-binding protein, partial [Alphaproteobacteria bacterium]